MIEGDEPLDPATLREHSRKIRALVREALAREAATYAEIRTLQARLGTPAEQPNDSDRLLSLAHRLKSLACVTQLKGTYL